MPMTMPLDLSAVAQDLTFSGNRRIVFNPTTELDFLRINNPEAFTGARYFEGEMQHAANPGSNGFDDVVRYGFNLDGGQIGTLPGLWYSMEPDYRPGSTDRWVESHMSVYHPDLGAGAGGEIRLSSHTFQYQTGQTAAATPSTWDFRANNGIQISKLTGAPYMYLTPTAVVWSSTDGTSGLKLTGTSNGTPTAGHASVTTIGPSVDAVPYRQLDFGNTWCTVSMNVPVVSGGTSMFDTSSKLNVAGKMSINSDLTLFGTGRRIRTESGQVATQADHPAFQSSTANYYTAMGVLPNGTAQQSYFFLSNRSNPNNSGILQFSATNTEAGINSVIAGTGAQLPLELQINGTAKLKIAVNGNISPPAGSTGMSAGFMHVSAAAGAPSGTPTNPTGTVPLYYDTTNNKLYVYNGGWKASAAFT